MDRDKFLTPEEAQAFGLIDEIVVHRPTELDVMGAGAGDGESKG